MEGSLAGNQDKTLRLQQPQQGGLAIPSDSFRRPGDNGNNLLPSASSVSLCDDVSVVTQPSMVTLRGNESSTDLLTASAPFARANSLPSRPSVVSSDEPSTLLVSAEPRRTISVKPSLASLPESPEFSTEARLSPVQSAAVTPGTVPVAPIRDTKSTTVPLTPADDQGKWQNKIKGLKRSLGDFLRVFTYSTWKDRFFLCLSIIAAIGAGAALPLMTIVFGMCELLSLPQVLALLTSKGQLIGSIASVREITMQQAHDKYRDLINKYVLYLVYLFIGRFILGYIATVSMLSPPRSGFAHRFQLGFRMMSIRISSALRLAYVKALLELPVSLLDTQPPGQIAAIITTTANTLQIGISEKLAIVIQTISLIVAALTVAFTYSWKLALVTSSGLLLITICYCVTIPFLVKNMKQVEDANIKASAVASETFASIRMVAAYGAETKMIGRYRKWVDKAKRRGLRLSGIVAVQQATMSTRKLFRKVPEQVSTSDCISTFALAFCAPTTNLDAYSHRCSILMCVTMIAMGVGHIAAPISAAARAAGAGRILFNGIDAPRPVTTGLKYPEASATGNIVLWNVNFTYPTRPNLKVLDNLNLTIPAGKVTAIVGPSGSGKSTIVALIQRWYEMDGDMGDRKLILFFRNGSVTVGGRKLTDLDLKWWRSQIGLVQQEPFLFSQTIFDNVASGLVGTDWEDADSEVKRDLVQAACKEAYADEFISRLPDVTNIFLNNSINELTSFKGYETQVGDAGIKLSGGQRQRLAIARAIIKRPKILILDEATSSIDVRGEKVVQAALDRVSKNRTTIMIAHRLTTVKKADNIVVLAKGKVVQWGNHESLMATTGGPYWLLTQSQELKMGGDSSADDVSEITEHEKRTMDLMTLDNSKADNRNGDSTAADDNTWVPRGLFRSFGTLLLEQKQSLPWYLLMLYGALIAGGGELLKEITAFWCLMFVVLAGAAAIGYFCLGFASTRVAFLQEMLGTNITFTIISILSVLGCLIVSFYFGWKLTLVAISSAMPLALAAGFYRMRVEKRFETMNLKVFAESAKYATESVGAIRTVTALTLEDIICQRYEELLRNHVKEAFKRARFATFVFAASDSLPLLAMAFLLWYGGTLLISGEYMTFNYCELMMTGLLECRLILVQGAMGAGQWLSFAPNIAQAAAAANRIQAMRAPDRNCGAGASLNLKTISGDNGGVAIELRDVWFRYPTRDVAVLNGLNMTDAERPVSSRSWKVVSGQILLDGIDIEDIDVTGYRKAISLVAQESSLFDGTIRENVLLGVNADAYTDSTLHKVCRDAGIHDFIVSLPEGYDTKVGIKGILLSGGQRQRISIARALIRNPHLLLLDEATSNLDSETEKMVQDVFERTKKDRTMIVVAHRLATIQNADIIFVLGDGQVLETGTHSSLLQKRGVYYSMADSVAVLMA
ncbi:hypothetical protein FHL15_005840 [Xylaria flabelliformis]|uniref:ABC transporter domain-containing protein n=1 Tax=Xylaria flabelliformis TaxID=2512241 RepID=A0A553HZ94_9PEZI|nr:hypothetical protein FHL15_005840 [Xylaria flabelliformis]